LALRTSPLAGHITKLVVSLYALEWLRLMLDEHHAEHRLALQLIAVLGAAGFAYCALRARGLARSGWAVTSFACVIGLFACLSGFVPFGVLLVEGTIASAFIAVVLMALHWALMGLTDAALTTTFALSTVLGRHAVVTRQTAHRASRLALGAGFVWITLDYYRLQTVVAEQARAALAETIALGELDIALGEVLAFALGIWAAIVASRVLSTALEEDVAPRLELGPGVPAAAALIVRYTVLALGFLLAAAAAGIGLSQLALFAGALGVGVGFGLQNVVSNFVSGLLLVFERPVKVGDTVDIAGVRGTIKAIGIRASTVRSWTGADVIIPNAKLIDAELVNWTHADRSMRADITVGVAYGTDLRRAHAVLLEATQTIDAALASPAPAVLMTGFGDSSIDFRVQVWIANPPDLPRVVSELGLAIDDALGAAGIEIPFPQRDLHIRTDATKGA
jgi:small-conductance mechanosensitive channel